MLAPSKGMKRQILEMGVRAPVEMLPTGLEESFFETDARRAEEIRREYLQDRKYLFCTVSRLEIEKEYSVSSGGRAQIEGGGHGAFPLCW